MGAPALVEAAAYELASTHSPELRRALFAFASRRRTKLAGGHRHAEVERGFTERERQVFFELVLSGGTVHELAARLGITPNTVNNHLKGIFKATRTNSRMELLSLFIRETLSPECIP
jgi:DNA-binding NarL/FixJ family response regulator